MYVQRRLEKEIRESLRYFPVTAITGPRQCGKSTLAKRLMEEAGNGLYLDLERPSDLAKFNEPELFLSTVRDRLICIDEIQRRPELFPLIRSLVDEWGRPGAFLILGSASRDLLRQSSESLAGRIAYHRLTPFLWEEIRKYRPNGGFSDITLDRYLTVGAFPASLLLENDSMSFLWRENFILTFLERDLPQWTGASPDSIRRLWRMLAHVSGQTANYTALASSLGVSDQTLRGYVDLLSSTYMVESIPPYHSNLGKRMRKAPKIYVADSGLTCALLGLRSYEDLLGHPGFGALWEQVVLSNLRGTFPGAEICHYRSAGGAEIDFVVSLGHKVFAVECKASLNPILTKGTHCALDDIKPQRAFVVSPVSEGWPLAEGIDVLPLDKLSAALKT
ncbi:MAG: ATP-binding protein [Synergistaceae bacterium]|nr:ATP-binding protein [Synergistaceae bacterium]